MGTPRRDGPVGAATSHERQRYRQPARDSPATPDTGLALLAP
ncbi:hypothetical protein [Actinomyces wuliandei]|nr:hypothetical protein [Actinomyces wuliandei]